MKKRRLLAVLIALMLFVNVISVEAFAASSSNQSETSLPEGLTLSEGEVYVPVSEMDAMMLASTNSCSPPEGFTLQGVVYSSTNIDVLVNSLVLSTLLFTVPGCGGISYVLSVSSALLNYYSALGPTTLSGNYAKSIFTPDDPGAYPYVSAWNYMLFYANWDPETYTYDYIGDYSYYDYIILATPPSSQEISEASN
ncbi:MAG: hypothetical protein EOM54_06720 [Clostridia bacterium]|nr:hypothetical protein [Clostridia bacterium]